MAIKPVETADSTKEEVRSFHFCQLPRDVQLEILGYLFSPWSIVIKKYCGRVVGKYRVHHGSYKLYGPDHYTLSLMSVSKHFAALVRPILQRHYTGQMVLRTELHEKLIVSRIERNVGFKVFCSQTRILRGKHINVDWITGKVGRKWFPQVKVIDSTQGLTRHGYLVSKRYIYEDELQEFLAGTADGNFIKHAAYAHWLGTENDLSSSAALADWTTQKTLYVENAFNARTSDRLIHYIWPGDVLYMKVEVTPVGGKVLRKWFAKTRFYNTTVHDLQTDPIFQGVTTDLPQYPGVDYENVQDHY